MLYAASTFQDSEDASHKKALDRPEIDCASLCMPADYAAQQNTDTRANAKKFEAEIHGMYDGIDSSLPICVRQGRLEISSMSTNEAMGR